MDSADPKSLEEVLEAQKRLHVEMARLDAAIASLRLAPPAPPQPAPPQPHTAPVLPLSIPPPIRPPPMPPATASPMLHPAQIEPPARGSVELRLGTYWFVRIGIVVLLTGLVFLGNYAYNNYLGLLGPWARLAFFYLAGGALTALGLWMEGKGESLRNYARVLTGGGLAAIYYTTYAAHHVERLRVIESPWVSAVSLLLCAGLIAGLAEVKRSQTLAVFGIALALYTSAISRFASFTLVSNLLLALIAMWMVYRHGWRALAFVTLAGTYGSYSIWRFGIEVEPWLADVQRWEPQALFLTLYWAVFTAGAWRAKPETLGNGARLSLSFLNTGAAFVLLALTIAETGKLGFSTLSLCSAAVLGGLALVSTRRAEPRDRLSTAFAAQALFFLTLGILTRFTGPTLSLCLGVEAVCLAVAWGCLPRMVLRIGALCAAALATLSTLPSLLDESDRVANAAVMLLLFGLAAGIEKVARKREQPLGWVDGLLYGFAGFMLFLPLASCVVPQHAQPAAFAGAAVLLTFSYRLLESKGLVAAGQLACAAAVMGFLFQVGEGTGEALPLTAPPVALSVIGLTAAGLFPTVTWAGQASAVYRLGAGLLYAVWVYTFVPAAWVFLVLAASATAVVFLKGGGWERGTLVLMLSTFGVLSGLEKLLPDGTGSLGDLAAWLLILVQSARFEHMGEENDRAARAVLAGAGMGGIWLHVNQWATVSHPGLPLTACWSLLALVYLGAGFLLRRRVFRLGGMLLLALSLGRMVVVDLWQHGTLVRIVSVIVMGAVLLLLGFVYNRYQETLKKWL